MPLGTRRQAADHPVALIQLEDAQSRIGDALAVIDVAINTHRHPDVRDILLEVRYALAPGSVTR
jgi:hypothetical protein